MGDDLGRMFTRRRLEIAIDDLISAPHAGNGEDGDVRVRGTRDPIRRTVEAAAESGRHGAADVRLLIPT